MYSRTPDWNGNATLKFLPAYLRSLLSSTGKIHNAFSSESVLGTVLAKTGISDVYERRYQVGCMLICLLKQLIKNKYVHYFAVRHFKDYFTFFNNYFCFFDLN